MAVATHFRLERAGAGLLLLEKGHSAGLVDGAWQRKGLDVVTSHASVLYIL